jgi:hypothetical protein
VLVIFKSALCYLFKKIVYSRLHLGPVWIWSILKGFGEYYALVLGTNEVFGCNKLCDFRNHSIAKSATILEFLKLHSWVFFPRPWFCLVLTFKTMVLKKLTPRRGLRIHCPFHLTNICMNEMIDDQRSPRFCRSGFMTFLPVPLSEQYRCGSFVGGAQIARWVGYSGIRWTRRFTWFRPSECNTLRPRVRGVALLCLSARLRSSLFSPSVRACVCGVRPLWLSSVRTFYSPRSGSYREVPWPDRWPRGW